MNRPTRWLGPLLIVVAFIAMASATWLKLCDPIIDFGRELYVPWRITQGDVLYRDIAYFNGPLSPYVNALWFAMFGASLRTLVVANLCVLAVMLWLVYRLVRLAADRVAATLACLTVIAVFAFGQYTVTGNFNWICPYSHELTHGLTLALGALYLLVRKRSFVGAGLLFGCVLLTKVEVTVAAAAMLIPAISRLRLSSMVRIGICALIPPLLAAGALCAALPPITAVTAVTGAWRYMFDATHTIADPFNQRGMGTDEPIANLLRMADWFARYVVALIPGILFALFARRRRWLLVPAVLLPLTLLFIWPNLGLADIGRALPLFVLIFAAMVIRSRSRRGILQASLALLALGMLLKMPLNARMYHYGFAHALPAAIVVVMCLAHRVPQWLASRGGDRRVYLAALMMLWLLVASAHVRVTLQLVAMRTVVVGEGADRFHAIDRGRFVVETVKLIREKTAGDATLAVFPEGVMLNYLARRRTPTRYLNFIPHEVKLYGEDRMLAALRASPPDAVVFVTRDTSEYGHQFFGRDYAEHLYAFLLDAYQRFGRLGGEPFTDDDFGVVVLFGKSSSVQ